ncbi:MAG: hypothetical protein V4690_02345 [Patescibacteria group bacterium]
MKLYSVITIVQGWPSPAAERFGGARTVAICTDLQQAKKVVEENIGDIFEKSYDFALVVEFEANQLYGGLDTEAAQYWYQWEGDSETGKYVPIDQPNEYQKVLFSF